MSTEGASFETLTSGQRRYLADRYGLDETELAKLLDDVWLFTQETPAAYALRRHEECRKAGVTNERSFELIRGEVAAGRFAAPPLSLRQVKRIIYG